MTYEYPDPFYRENSESIMGSRAAKRLQEEKKSDAPAKFDAILALFGTDEARAGFRRLVGEYYEKYRNQKLSKLLELQVTQLSETGRAVLHNQIMDVLQKLSIVVKPGSFEEEVLREFADRRNFHKAVTDLFMADPTFARAAELVVESKPSPARTFKSKRRRK